MEPSTVKQLHERKQPLAHEPITFEEHYLRYPGPQDEVSLIDLWLILVRRRRLIAVIVALAAGAGIAKALLTSPSYEYLTSIQIGQTVEDTARGVETRPLESAAAVLAKLQNGYIPRAVNDYRHDHPGDTQRYRISASVPKDSGLIVLKSTGSRELQPVYEALHDAVVASVTADQNLQLTDTRKALEVKLGNARIRLQQLKDPAAMTDGQADIETRLEGFKSKLAAVMDPQLREVPRLDKKVQLQEARDGLTQLRDQERVLKAGYGHLDDTAALLKTQIGDLQGNIRRAQARRDQAAAVVADGTQAMTLMMLDTELQKNRTLLADLQERRRVTLPSQREALDQQLNDNRRAQDEARHRIAAAEAVLAGLAADSDQQAASYRQQIAVLNKQLADLNVQRQARIDTVQQQIAGLQVELGRLRPTRAIATPDQTADRVGAGRSLVIALAVIIGVLLAVFAAFGAEFLHKARQAARHMEIA